MPRQTSEDSDLIAKLKETIACSPNSGATTEQWDRWFDVSTLDRDLRRKLSFHDLRRLGAHAIRAFIPEQEGASQILPEAAQQPTPPSSPSDLVKALEACIAMIDDSLEGREFEDGVYVAGVTDVELTPGGGVMLSHVRSALRSHRGEK